MKTIEEKRSALIVVNSDEARVMLGDSKDILKSLFQFYTSIDGYNKIEGNPFDSCDIPPRNIFRFD